MKITGNEKVLERLSSKLDDKGVEVTIETKVDDSNKKSEALIIVSFIVKSLLGGAVYDMAKMLTYDEGEKAFVEKTDGTKISWNTYINLSDEERSDNIFKV